MNPNQKNYINYKLTSKLKNNKKCVSLCEYDYLYIKQFFKFFIQLLTFYITVDPPKYCILHCKIIHMDVCVV